MSKSKTCPYAKSEMTPCYRRDGDVCLIVMHRRPHCVGCEHSQEWLDKQEKKP